MARRATALRKQFDPSGQWRQVAILLDIVRYEGPTVLPLARRAYRDGSNVVRAMALGIWRAYEPLAAGEAALGVVHARNFPVRQAAIEVVATMHGDDRALDALWQGLTLRFVKEALSEYGDGLRHFQHPQLAERVMTRLRPLLKAHRDRKETDPGEDTPEEALARAQHNRNESWITTLLLAITGKTNAAIDAELAPYWRKRVGLGVWLGVGHVLASSPQAATRALVVSGFDAKNDHRRRLATRAIACDPAIAFDRSEALFAPAALATERGRTRLWEFVGTMTDHWRQTLPRSESGALCGDGVDPRWEARGLALAALQVERPEYNLQEAAFHLLMVFRSQAALEAVLALDVHFEYRPVEFCALMKEFPDDPRACAMAG